jgi:uroporphyrinogen-III decarboxylase
MNIEALGAQFGGKITFWGEMDRQYLLPFGTTDEVSEAVRRVKDALYYQGGVIAQCEFGPGAKPENVYRMFQTWEDLFP